ncbi:tyrosine-type recombinase/integrase [Vibrio superstes]|uniref:Integrase n=1 Tax=Vibrio superstes NBRC 103154 TaxID=1219062 RepID=A0A511QME9_9VIBR|nr:site-specific integrase [Vibrio superstes]GEM78493.1 integrase [Vibrio superstes NBRC 103154]
MNTELNFTKRTLDNLPNPLKRTRFRDSGGSGSVAGLGLDVSPTGKKTFRYEKKVNGKNIKVTLGKYPDITVEQARNLAKEQAQKIADGVNPNEEKRKQRDHINFDALFEIYTATLKLDVQAKLRRPRSLELSNTLYSLHVAPVIGKNSVIDFTRQDAKTFLNGLLAKYGYSRHNHALTLLKSMYNRAELEVNPFKDIKKIDEALHRRTRTLSGEELERLLDSLNYEDQIYRDFVLVLLFTGQRKSNVISMQWNQINFETKTWTIPSENTKNKKLHAVPLSLPVVELLTERKNKANNRESFVFPSHRSSTGHISDKGSKGGFWRRIIERADLYDSQNKANNFRMHDLRRTLATNIVNQGGSIQAISKLLGHSNISITSDVYAHLAIDNVRTELESTTLGMLGENKALNKVIDLAKIKSDILSLSEYDRQELASFIQSLSA